MQKILSTVRKAVSEYSMIEENDKIAVGVSGGKDSLALLLALAKLKEFYPEKFSISAITVDPNFQGQKGDYSKVAAFCKDLGVEYSVVDTKLWEIVFKERKESNPCSLCSRMRKGALYDEAVRLGCNKVALGHHFDDAVVTFYMSLFKNGTLGCFSPKNELKEKGITVLRPLVLTEERDIVGLAKRENFPIIKSRCSENGSTERNEILKTVQMLEKDYKGLRNKTLGALKRSGICGW